MWKYDYFTVNKAYLKYPQITGWYKVSSIYFRYNYSTYYGEYILVSTEVQQTTFSWFPSCTLAATCQSRLLIFLTLLSSSWSVPEAHLWVSFHLYLHWLPWRPYLNLLDLSTIPGMVAPTFTSPKLYLRVSSCQLSMPLCLSDWNPTHAVSKTGFQICAHSPCFSQGFPNCKEWQLSPAGPSGQLWESLLAALPLTPHIQCIGSCVDFIFKIYPESNRFSLTPLIPLWSKPPVLFYWIIAITFLFCLSGSTPVLLYSQRASRVILIILCYIVSFYV